MKRQTTNIPYTVAISALLMALTGCVSIAPIEPVKNPPTKFRSDNVVAVEFLHPARVGLRCGERGTQAFGVPVFHAMACGNGKLITMPDPCATITGGAYARLVCDQREQPVFEPAPVPEWQGLLQPASFGQAARPAPTPLAPRAGAPVDVEFVHPTAVRQRCATRGLDVLTSEAADFAACGDTRLITLPNPCFALEAGWYTRTLCHEMAHANGWAMDHPGGSYLTDARAGVDPNDVPPPRALLASLAAPGALRPASESPAHLAFMAARAAETGPAAAAPEALILAAADAPTSPALQDLLRPAVHAAAIEADGAASRDPGLALASNRPVQAALAPVSVTDPVLIAGALLASIARVDAALTELLSPRARAPVLPEAGLHHIAALRPGPADKTEPPAPVRLVRTLRAQVPVVLASVSEGLIAGLAAVPDQDAPREDLAPAHVTLLRLRATSPVAGPESASGV